MFAAIGITPNSALYEGLVELDAQGYIVADETGRTSAPGVFAAGDIRTKAFRQIITAQRTAPMRCTAWKLISMNGATTYRGSRAFGKYIQ